MPITASEGAAKFAKTRDQLDDLIKRRFFYRQAFEIYGGVGGFYTYGPPGTAVKQNLISLWRKHFVIEENMLEVDDTCIMPHDVLFTSGAPSAQQPRAHNRCCLLWRHSVAKGRKQLSR